MFWGRDGSETCKDTPIGLNGKLCQGNDYKMRRDFEKVHSNCKSLQGKIVDGKCAYLSLLLVASTENNNHDIETQAQ